jgi:hypothetical protein
MTMPSRLLDRQVDLLEYLTSNTAIFRDMADTSLNRTSLGIDDGLLHLEARFSHEKRMTKIAWVLPRTLDLMETAMDTIVRDFVAARPPASISRIENARQFHDFLAARWRVEAPKPPWLPEVAACELAYADAGDGGKPADRGKEPAARGGIRRRPGVTLIRCRYDVRSILEGRGGEAAVAERATPLAIWMTPDAEHPSVSKLSPDLFDLLETLDDFVVLEAFSSLPEVSEFIADLNRRGLLEVRP